MSSDESFDELMAKYRAGKNAQHEDARFTEPCGLSDASYASGGYRSPSPHGGSSVAQGSYGTDASEERWPQRGPERRADDYGGRRGGAEPRRDQPAGPMANVSWSAILKVVVILVVAAVAVWLVVNVAMALWGMRDSIINAVVQIIIFVAIIVIVIRCFKTMLK